MKVLLFLLLGLLVTEVGFSQKAFEALEGEHSLRERYVLMKSNSQTYGDYKVIKEKLLDGVWKIQQDSLKAKAVALQEANENITELRVQLNQTISSLEEKEQSMEEVLFASTHINVLGMEVGKGIFITLTAIIIGGLIALIGLVLGRMKLQSAVLSERKLALHTLSDEYNDYKHRAMDRQIKLSRELQDERNKLEAIHRNS